MRFSIAFAILAAVAVYAEDKKEDDEVKKEDDTATKEGFVGGIGIGGGIGPPGGIAPVQPISQIFDGQIQVRAHFASAQDLPY